jgi:hypothetical protein
MEFVPFDADEEEVAGRQVLRDGIPAGMRSGLLRWLAKTLSSQGYVAPATLHELENNLDVSLDLSPRRTTGLLVADVIGMLMKLNDRDLLRAADFRLFKQGNYSPYAQELEAILRDGRSKYQVVDRGSSHRLAERVPEGTRVAAESLMTTAGTAGRLLATAWGKVYDLEPDDSGAYAAAVKAVETAAFAALDIPADANANVSTVVRAIEGKGATWRLPFVREHTEAPSRDVLLGMLKSLYKGQRDRHGSAAYTDVTHDEAEAAVLLAVSLVGLFANGLVQQRDVDRFG